jgi:hypothetical protein
MGRIPVYGIGQVGIYVRDFPGGGNRVQVSIDGGSEPVWARGGKELFYRTGKKLISVPVIPGTDFVRRIHFFGEPTTVRPVYSRSLTEATLIQSCQEDDDDAPRPAREPSFCW